MVQKTLLEIVDLILAKVPLNHPQLKDIKVIHEGMTNSNYLCTTFPDKKYVIRIPGPNTSEIINREYEWANHQRIELLKLNTKHIFYLKGTWIKASLFVENKFPFVSSKFKQIDLVCKALKRLHNSEIIFNNRFWIADVIQSYENVAKKKGIELEIKYKSLKNILKNEYEAFLYSNMDWTTCHNDLVKENIIWDGKRTYLIDWEYSGMNDPIWDIASFILENELDDEHEAYMLKQYYNNPTKTIRAKLILYKIYQDLLWYVWSKIRQREGFEYFQYSSKRLQRAVNNYSLLSLKL